MSPISAFSSPGINSFPSATNRTRVVRKAMPAESFFNFFTPPTPPSEEAVENGEIDEDELEDLEERLELDYQIGEDLKERVCFLPFSLTFRGAHTSFFFF